MGKAIYDCELLPDQGKVQGGKQSGRTHSFSAADRSEHTSSGCIGVFT